MPASSNGAGPFAKAPDATSASTTWRDRFSASFATAADASRCPPWDRLRWGRIASVALLGSFAIHALIAGLAFALIRYGRGVEGVSYLDLLAPHRWSNYRVAVGEREISLATNSVREGRRREACLLLRTGLGRAPANRTGRLLLAQSYLEDGQPDVAAKTLLDGLEFHRNDPQFLQPLFRILRHQQQDPRALALARSLLSTQPPNSARDRVAALAAATVCFFRGEFDQAENFLDAVPSLPGSRDGQLLAAEIDYARGYHDLALVALRSLAAEFPHDLEIHHELVQRLRESGSGDEARRRSLSFQIAHPALAGPRLELLHDLRDSAEPVRAAREVDALIRDFAADSDALLALADFAVATADPELARRLFAHSRAQALPWEPHALLVVESLVTARDHHGALAAADALAREFPDFAKHFEPPLNGLRGIAHYGLGEAEVGRLFIGQYLSQPCLRTENLMAVAQRLLDVAAPAAARDTLVRAVAADPLNQAALTRLVELDLNLDRIDELPAHLRRLVTMRQPPPDLLRVARHKLGSDRFLFSAERQGALDAVRAALERQPSGRSRR